MNSKEWQVAYCDESAVRCWDCVPNEETAERVVCEGFTCEECHESFGEHRALFLVRDVPKNEVVATDKMLWSLWCDVKDMVDDDIMPLVPHTDYWVQERMRAVLGGFVEHFADRIQAIINEGK